MARKVPISLHLDQTHVDRLAKLRKETKVPVSAHMRMALDAYLDLLDEDKRVIGSE